MTTTTIKTNMDGWEISLRGDDVLSITNPVKGDGTSLSLGQESKFALVNAIELSHQWAAAGSSYFVLFDGLDFTLLPYIQKKMDEEHIITLCPYARDMLSHILRAK